MTPLLRTAALIVAMLGAPAATAAQSTVVGVPLELASRGVAPPRVENGAAAGVSGGLASSGPRRQSSFGSTSAPYSQERELAATATRMRGRTAGALIGAVVGGAVGFSGGFGIDNAERSGGSRIGTATVVGTAGGALAGALVGGAIGWLLER